MSDSVVHIGENSPEQVAYKLYTNIAHAEKKSLHGPGNPPDRDWIIRTYCTCLKAVQQPGYPDDALELGQPKPQ